MTVKDDVAFAEDGADIFDQSRAPKMALTSSISLARRRRR
jgi:hypothetical protein